MTFRGSSLPRAPGGEGREAAGRIAMPTYALKVKGRGEETTYSVDFPYDAYDCQVTMMERVVEALHDGEHALLESPTGGHPLTSTYDPPLLASTT